MAPAPDSRLFSFRRDHPWARLLRAAYQKVYADLLTLRAAALSYWSLLSLVPLLAVTFSVLKAFGVENVIEPFLAEALEPLGSGRTEIIQRIVAFVRNTEVGVLGVVGVAGLFYTVISLIGNVEEALNRIWRAQTLRSWTHRYGEYLGFLLVGPVLMFAAFALIASAQSYSLVQALLEVRAFGPVLALLTRVLPFFFLWAGFTLLYKIMPGAAVRWRSALFGAAVAAILWQLAGMAFTAFVVDSVNYRAIYSGFAVAVVFFIWLNLAWLIVLLGGVVGYLHQHARIYMRGWPVEGTPGFAFEEWLMLNILSEIARGYLAGAAPPTESDLSERLGIPAAQIGRAIDKCVRRGLVLRSAEPQGVSLARAPEAIETAEILETARGELNLRTSDGDAVTAALRRRDAALRHALKGLTLKSLIQNSFDDLPESTANDRRDHRTGTNFRS